MENEKEVFAHLDALRESGVMNMMGAAPTLQTAFDMTRSEAKDALLAWMRRGSEPKELERNL